MLWRFLLEDNNEIRHLHSKVFKLVPDVAITVALCGKHHVNPIAVLLNFHFHVRMLRSSVCLGCGKSILQTCEGFLTHGFGCFAALLNNGKPALYATDNCIQS